MIGLEKLMMAHAYAYALKNDIAPPLSWKRLPCGYEPGDCCAAGTGCGGCGNNTDIGYEGPSDAKVEGTP